MAAFRWNQRELDRLLNSQNGPVGRDLDAKARRAQEAQKERAPVSPDGSHGRPAGYMRDSITRRHGRDSEGQFVDVGPTAETPDGHPYPLDVEFGTRPHTIESKGDYPLRDEHGNVFGKTVNHPGTEAQPFIRPSIEAIRDQ
ncbi:hypothetical protein AB0F72_09040 [Actinoplanes sp. NPDC023936]|uniref:hypothetical protein n=1 Tax=Actinoplanes sp. NPDC023936 TaxID=3154910 RepID=UPI0033C0EC79